MFDKTLEEQQAVPGDVISLVMPGSGRLRVARVQEVLYSPQNSSVFVIKSVRRDGTDGPVWAVMGKAKGGWEIRKESVEDLLGIPKGYLAITSTVDQEAVKKMRDQWLAMLGKRVTFPGIDPVSNCDHQWVDVGFQHSKIICKKCNQEKTYDSRN